MNILTLGTQRMANFDNVVHAGLPVPYKKVHEANSHLIEKPSDEHDALMETLPLQPVTTRRISLHGSLLMYKGVWISKFFLRGALCIEQRFKPRPNDLILASSPKSGTTWLKAMIFATLAHTSYPLDKHPLHAYNPHQCVPFLEGEFAVGRSQIIEAIPSPRAMSTHLPYSMLPDSIKDSNCRIIYVWRDPKDALVSQWWFLQKILGGADKIATFDQFYEFFCEGVNAFGPIWNHILGYWEESKRKPEKVLFLKYEHILQEPVKHAKQLAHFIGCPYSEDEENQGMVEQIVELCSFKKLKNIGLKDEYIVSSDAHISHEYFFRKGEAGDWKSHMTEEMAGRLDAIIKDKFKGSGLEI